MTKPPTKMAQAELQHVPIHSNHCVRMLIYLAPEPSFIISRWQQ